MRKFIRITDNRDFEVIELKGQENTNTIQKATKKGIKETIAPSNGQQQQPQNPWKINLEKIRDNIKNSPERVLGNAISNRLWVLQGTQHPDFGKLEYIIWNLYSGTMTREQALNLIYEECSPETYNKITKELSKQ